MIHHQQNPADQQQIHSKVRIAEQVDSNRAAGRVIIHEDADDFKKPSPPAGLKSILKNVHGRSEQTEQKGQPHPKQIGHKEQPQQPNQIGKDDE
jgi:hypothetical protein